MPPDDSPSVVVGYYTLSASVALEDLPADFVRKLPRYPFVPASLLGRLARNERFPGTGKLLLTDALERAWRQSGQIAAASMIVEAKDDRARKFTNPLDSAPCDPSIDHHLRPPAQWRT
jgi:hypothetical protein